MPTPFYNIALLPPQSLQDRGDDGFVWSMQANHWQAYCQEEDVYSGEYRSFDGFAGSRESAVHVAIQSLWVPGRT